MLKPMINEELTNSEVRNIINSKLDDFIKEKEFEKRVREISSDALEKFFKMMYNKINIVTNHSKLYIETKNLDINKLNKIEYFYSVRFCIL